MTERVDWRAFMIGAGVATLGCALGVLDDKGGNGRFYNVAIIGTNDQSASAWRDLPVDQVRVVAPFTPLLVRRVNGVETAGPTGAMIGLGALGSHIIDLWFRSGWGTWTLIDGDRLEPHNLARHTACFPHLGTYKVDAIAALHQSLFAAEDLRPPVTVTAHITNADTGIAWEHCDAAELVVDTSASLGVARDLGARRNVRRACSAFVTPSGQDSVLLMEDGARSTRLDALEAQYYRAILNAPWGERHLRHHEGSLWPGAGCRQPSAVIPNHLISMHAAILAAQVRACSGRDAAAIRVWCADDEGGAVQAHAIPTARAIKVHAGGWRVVWDEEVQRNVRGLRAQKLPVETGGVLVGYWDFQLRAAYVVSALPAPRDSDEDGSGFTRGVEGLASTLKAVQERTGYVVGYLGEWHSHPPGVCAAPSGRDATLLSELAAALQQDGQPALMLIVGEDEESWHVS